MTTVEEVLRRHGYTTTEHDVAQRGPRGGRADRLHLRRLTPPGVLLDQKLSAASGDSSPASSRAPEDAPGLLQQCGGRRA